jgi:hypothetical protein
MKLNFKFPEWEPQYKAAIFEVDRAKLLEAAGFGKEAPYLADKIIGGQDMPDSGTPRVRVVGLN